MGLTREFKITLQERAQSDADFRASLLSESLNLLLNGDLETGKSVLRDYINATIGFERLAQLVDTPAKSLMRMFGAKGNPRSDNLFRIIHVLQTSTGVRLSVGAAA